jgi:hypothetical protein
MKWWLAALVGVSFVVVVVPRFGWGAAAQEQRQARADAKQVASAVCGAFECEVRQQGPFVTSSALVKAATFWQIRIERPGSPDLCLQLMPGAFRATSPRLRAPRAFRATPRYSFTGVAKAPCAWFTFE